jgi:hypothetical protein
LLNATHKSHRQQRVSQHSDHVDSLRFFNLLTSAELFNEVETRLPEHRERVFPPTETLSLFLTQVMNADQSCQHIVNQAAVQRIAMGILPCSTHTGGYCRARQRLPVDLITHLTRFMGERLSEQAPQQWCWRQRRVLLVDGTTVTMPDTPANQHEFPQQGGQLPGLGFPIGRIVGITCLGSGALLNAAIGKFNGKGSGETGLLRSLQDTFQPGDILLGDAFYATYFFMAEMIAKGVDVVMEQHGSRRRSTDFRRGRRLSQRDHVIQINKPNKPDWMRESDYEVAPASITVRECRVAGRVLVTTIGDPSIHKSELGALYQRRWQIELDIRNIKDTMGMNILGCRTPEMAVKEIWVTLLAYNLIRLMMAQSALLADLLPRTLSFKHCLQLWLSWRQQCLGGGNMDYRLLFTLMAQQRIGKRPGRIEPRAVKRRPKAYPLLRKPRDTARQIVLDFGHPKKLK